MFAPYLACAQTPPQIPPGALLQLQVAQPAVDSTTPVAATAAFDPPTVRVGEKAFYRVNVDATESSIVWPDQLAVPEQLGIGAQARGQVTQLQPGSFRPLTTFLYEMQATAAGRFIVTNFSISVLGETVQVPAASLEVVAANAPAASPPPRRLSLDLSATNVFLGQPFRARVMLPPGPANDIEALKEIQFNGDGLMTDKTATRQSTEPINLNGQIKTVFLCEMVVTPITAGRLKFFAQGFTAGHEFTPPITFHGQVNLSGGPTKYVLLVSDSVEIMARPLPVEGELPGFTGAIGKFFSDPPKLATNRLHVGEPVQLKVMFHGEGELTRLVPPAAPRVRDWQVIADPPPATSFTLIPLSDEVRETPAIPFSYFDPEAAKYVNLTVPSVPVTVIGEGLPVELPTTDDQGKSAAPLKLSTMAASPGKAASLRPLQLRTWMVVLQLVPVAAFIGLWQWDRRRRFLEAHPEIVRRMRARRALRAEKRQLEEAVADGDTAAFVSHAARAMSIAVAPHYPANPQALVGGDVLAQLDEAERNGQFGETVKRVFTAADAQFALTPQASPDFPALRAGVDAVLQKLEDKL